MSGWASEPMGKPVSGWGDKDNNIASKIGMEQNKNMWDERVQELDIPELEADAEPTPQDDNTIPPEIDNKMLGLEDLEKDMAHNVPSQIEEGVDLSILTSVIRPIADLIEADISWDYKSLQAEIGQAYREKFAKESKEHEE
ncbi:unnamed protein product [Moneuplotes crassus]|uniref:Uncharacterized protein n=1 Tax=Euplotes crassus TaxID=5936 RepID=A0AAD1Y5H1_EUPCR|nr:unnamed protein product [Moneuplotes crassus]